MSESIPQWEKVEENVNNADLARRKGALSGAEAFAAGKEIDPDLARILNGESAEADNAVDALLGEPESQERALASLRYKNLSDALRGLNDLTKKGKVLRDKESRLLEALDAGSGERILRGKQKQLDETRANIAKIGEERDALEAASPEAFVGAHALELREYKRELDRGGIVETPYVKERADDIEAHLRGSVPALIYGHLGSGKTELAMHIARNRIGKEALVISGSKYTSLAELYGHQMLKTDEQSGATISDFFLGPVYRAMSEGRPIIIDEVNAIPHEVLISLNYLMMRRPGDVVNVQQNSGTKVTVKEGFCVLMTGNLNQGQKQYIDRQDMDPAFLSRLYKIEYDYLPQAKEGTLETDAAPDNELFQLMLARIMDRQGNAELPAGSMQKLWRLAQAARLTQDVFAGREIASAHFFQQGGGRALRYSLKESVLSLRALDRILGAWQSDGYAKELDHYIYREFISQSTVASDRAYLYQEFKDRFDFFKTDGWDQSPDYGVGGVVQGFSVKSPVNVAPKDREFFGPRQLVTFGFGPPPKREVWPDTEISAEAVAEKADTAVGEQIAGREARANILRERLGRLRQFSAVKNPAIKPHSAEKQPENSSGILNKIGKFLGR